eukprot:COSAG06_NODE_36824_length_442_cov_1.020408_1_plen_51_part_10
MSEAVQESEPELRIDSRIHAFTHSRIDSRIRAFTHRWFWSPSFSGRPLVMV